MNHDDHHVSFFLFSTRTADLLSHQKEILGALDRAPRFRPSVWGFNPPIARPFSPEAVDSAYQAINAAGHWDPLVLRDGDNGFSYLVDAKPGSDGMWHVSGGFDANLIEDAADGLIELVDRLAIIMDCAYGQIVYEGTPGSKMPFDLCLRLPEIPNVSYYGRNCIDHFGQERIMTAPFVAHQVLHDSLIRLHAAPSIIRPLAKPEQAAIRAHLGEAAFVRHPKRRYRNGDSPLRPDHPK
jgi:hypothetical protein